MFIVFNQYDSSPEREREQLWLINTDEIMYANGFIGGGGRIMFKNGVSFGFTEHDWSRFLVGFGKYLGKKETELAHQGDAPRNPHG